MPILPCSACQRSWTTSTVTIKLGALTWQPVSGEKVRKEKLVLQNPPPPQETSQHVSWWQMHNVNGDHTGGHAQACGLLLEQWSHLRFGSAVQVQSRRRRPVHRLQKPCARPSGEAESSSPGSSPTEQKAEMTDSGDPESLVRSQADQARSESGPSQSWLP